MRKFVVSLILCVTVLTAALAWAVVNDASPNGERIFRVCVSDGSGPVKDAAIQFCSETVCQIDQTNAQGVATFDMPEGKSYEIHVLKVPAGYEMNTEVFKTLDVYSDVFILLKKNSR